MTAYYLTLLIGGTIVAACVYLRYRNKCDVSR